MLSQLERENVCRAYFFVIGCSREKNVKLMFVFIAFCYEKIDQDQLYI